jgi:hypothetical protein
VQQVQQVQAPLRRVQARQRQALPQAWQPE